MDQITAYRILGLPTGASEHDIKKAYRLKALATHPDRHRGDPNAVVRFKQVTEAYNSLKEPMSTSSDVVQKPQDFRSAFAEAAATLRSQKPSTPESYSLFRPSVVSQEGSQSVYHTFPVLTSCADVMEYFFSFDTDRLQTILRAREAGSSSLEGILDKLFPEQDSSHLVSTVSEIFSGRINDVGPILFYAQQVLGDDASVELTLAVARTLIEAPNFEAMVGAGSFCRAIYDHPVSGRGVSSVEAASVFSKLYPLIVNRWKGREDRSDLRRLFMAVNSFAKTSLKYDSRVNLLSLVLLPSFSLEESVQLLETSSSGITSYYNPKRTSNFFERFAVISAEASRLCANGYVPSEAVGLFSLVGSIQKSPLDLRTVFNPERFARFVNILSSCLQPGQVASGDIFAKALFNGARGYFNENFPSCAEEWRDALTICLPIVDSCDSFSSAQAAFSELYFRSGHIGQNPEREMWEQGIHVPVVWAAEAGATLARCASLEQLSAFRSFLAGYRSTRYHPHCTVARSINDLTPSQHGAYALLRRAVTTSRNVQGLKVAKGKMHYSELLDVYDIFSSSQK